MISPVDAYLRSITSKFKFRANWPLSAPRALGDVGVLVGNEFQRQRGLADLEVTFTSLSGNALDGMSHTSGEATDLRLKLKGDALAGSGLPLDSAGATVAFADAGAFVFQAASVVVEEIEDQHALARALVQLLKQKKWEPEWCVITVRLVAARLVVLLAEASLAKVELTVRGELGPAPVPLAGAAGSLAITRRTGAVMEVLASTPSTALFHASRLKRSIVDRILGKEPVLARAGAEDEGDWLEVAPVI